MKSELDALMAKRNLDAFVVTGGEGENIPRYYLTNGAHITSGTVLKARGKAPLLVVNPMEVEEARKSGLRVVTQTELGFFKLLQETGDRAQAALRFWGLMLRAAGITSGRVGVYGRGEINQYLHQINALDAMLPEFEFIGEGGLTLFDEAMQTKDADEIRRIQSVAERTNAVLQATWDYLQSHAVRDDTLITPQGDPLTVKTVKRFIRRALLDRDLEAPEFIFAPGAEGAYPHNVGGPDTPLRLGESIVFDLFPRELGGGYHHDVTRTWCLGHAPAHIQQAYDVVMEAFDKSIEAFGVGKPTNQLDALVNEHFEAAGYNTRRVDSDANKGYVHSLGHGLGLHVHERPSIVYMSTNDTFQVGNVITIEPGLYDPDAGYGLRVEDTCYVDSDGQLVSLTPFKKDLVIPLPAK